MNEELEIKQQLREAILAEITTLKRHGFIKDQGEIDDAYKVSKATTKAMNLESDMTIKKREEVLEFIRKNYPCYRAIFWAASPDLNIWDRATFSLRKCPDDPMKLTVAAKGLYKNRPDGSYQGSVRLLSRDTLEMEIQSAEGKAFFVANFQKTHFDDSPNLGLIIGHYLAISGSESAGCPITSRPMLLFPAATSHTTVEDYKTWLLELKENPEWWRRKKEDWFKDLEKLSPTDSTFAPQ